MTVTALDTVKPLIAATGTAVYHFYQYKLFPFTYLLRLSSSRSEQNIGQRVVSIWHDRWQYLSRHFMQSTPNMSKSSFSVSCHVLFGLPTLLLPHSGIHSKARLAGLVVGSRRM